MTIEKQIKCPECLMAIEAKDQLGQLTKWDNPDNQHCRKRTVKEDYICPKCDHEFSSTQRYTK